MARAMIELPAGFAQELNTRVPLKILDLTPLASDPALLAAMPAVRPTPIPAGTYEWQPEAIQSISMRSFFIVHESVPAEHVNEFARLVYSQAMVDHLQNAYKGHGFYPRNRDPLAGLLIPLHPGAESFWKTTGVTMHAPALGD